MQEIQVLAVVFLKFAGGKYQFE